MRPATAGRLLGAALFCLPATAALAAPNSGAANAKEAEPTSCEAVPPGSNQYKLRAGFATARADTPRAKGEAMALARAEARKALETELCNAMPDDCKRYSGYITEWQTPGIYDKATRRACATAVVELRLLNPDRQRGDAETAISKLGDELAKKLVAAGQTSVRLTDPHRSDGCALPELEPVRMWIRARLGNEGIATVADNAEAAAPELDLSAAVSQGHVTLAATVTLADGKQIVATPIGFLAAAYNVPSSSAACVGSARLGLDGRGQRTGAVNLDMKVATRGGGLCAGQPIEPVVTVDQPGHLHVYSVDASGSAYHIWPIEGSDRVEGSFDLGESWAVPSSKGDDETMVAVIVPEGVALGPLSKHQGFCRVSSPFGPSLYPPGATVVSQTWHVVSGEGCGPVPANVPSPDLLESVLNGAPECQ
jgi:hypothetical protein